MRTSQNINHAGATTGLYVSKAGILVGTFVKLMCGPLMPHREHVSRSHRQLYYLLWGVGVIMIPALILQCLPYMSASQSYWLSAISAVLYTARIKQPPGVFEAPVSDWGKIRLQDNSQCMCSAEGEIALALSPIGATLIQLKSLAALLAIGLFILSSSILLLEPSLATQAGPESVLRSTYSCAEAIGLLMGTAIIALRLPRILMRIASR